MTETAAERAARQILKNKRAREGEGKQSSAKKGKGNSGDVIVTTKRNTRSLPFKEEHMAVLIAHLGCVSYVCPFTKKLCLFSALDENPIKFYTFPVVLAAPEGKKKLKGPNHQTLCGVARPELIFSVLRECFRICYPQEDPMRIQDWEIYKWNVAYYGQGIASRAPSWTELGDRIALHRSTGGDKNAIQVNIFNEVGTNKALYALDLAVVFPGKPTYLRQDLLDIKAEATKLAESGADLLIDKDELEKHVSAQEEESDSDEEDSYDEDEE